MRLTKRGEYALRALIDLGIAHEQGRAVVPIAEIAKKERIPAKFLEQILGELRRAGFLGSRRGVDGGYFVKGPLDRIRIGDVVRRVEGPLAPIACASVTAYAPCSCPDEETCGLRAVMLEVRNAIAGILDDRTLGEIVSSAMKRAPRKPPRVRARR